MASKFANEFMEALGKQKPAAKRDGKKDAEKAKTLKHWKIVMLKDSLRLERLPWNVVNTYQVNKYGKSEADPMFVSVSEGFGLDQNFTVESYGTQVGKYVTWEEDGEIRIGRIHFDPPLSFSLAFLKNLHR